MHTYPSSSFLLSPLPITLFLFLTPLLHHHLAQSIPELSAIFQRTRSTDMHHHTQPSLFNKRSLTETERHGPPCPQVCQQTRSSHISGTQLAPIFLCCGVWKQGCLISPCALEKATQHPQLTFWLGSLNYRDPVIPRTLKGGSVPNLIVQIAEFMLRGCFLSVTLHLWSY